MIPTFLPRPDGQFLVDVPQKLVVSGQVANIPIVSGVSNLTASPLKRLLMFGC